MLYSVFFRFGHIRRWDQCAVYIIVIGHEPAIQSKTIISSAVNFKKHVTSMSCRLEPAIWSHATCQQIPCFDRCQLIITWMSNIKEVQVNQGMSRSTYYWNLAAMLRDSTVAVVAVVVVVVRTRPRAIPPPLITMRKSIHGFLFPYMVMKLRLAVPRAAGAPL